MNLKLETWRYEFDWNVFFNTLWIWAAIFTVISVLFSFKASSNPVLNLQVTSHQIPENSMKNWNAIESRIETSSFWGLKRSADSEKSEFTSIEDQLKNYRLKGVIFLSGAEAILEDARSAKSLFVKEGDSLEGLIVKHISLDEVRFIEGSQEGKLFLNHYEK